MYAAFKKDWEASYEQFVEVPLGVLPGARFTGDRSNLTHVRDGAMYFNADGTNGNGDSVEDYAFRLIDFWTNQRN
jgi:hypothetical protein